jgi:hypothetical protein
VVQPGDHQDKVVEMVVAAAAAAEEEEGAVKVIQIEGFWWQGVGNIVSLKTSKLLLHHPLLGRVAWCA